MVAKIVEAIIIVSMWKTCMHPAKACRQVQLSILSKEQTSLFQCGEVEITANVQGLYITLAMLSWRKGSNLSVMMQRIRRP
ncbi:unnamed protein product [Taenia asiatica]|uniref:Secreted protein n=1 Tax=Taenia asiatica TaxID=60517 RepID=A0A0R3VZQ8_TAEAS|nr:unnamed protein product [Taenia asiatica]